jgi:hypothetical protein
MPLTIYDLKTLKMKSLEQAISSRKKNREALKLCPVGNLSAQMSMASHRGHFRAYRSLLRQVLSGTLRGDANVSGQACG